MSYREDIEWCDVWVEGAASNTRPRLLLVGDSITRSYWPQVRQELAGSYACARLATSKCVSDPLYFQELELLLGAYTFSVIHFNNGLHGWAYDEAAYADGLARALDVLGRHGARVIWGSTTPVWEPGGSVVLAAKTERVRERNRRAAALADARHLPINDLFAAAIDHPEYMTDDGIHFLEPGQIVLGQQVAQAIRALP